MARNEAFAVFAFDLPATGILFPGDGLDPGSKSDVLAKIEAIRDMIGVPAYLPLRRHDLAPVPLLLEFFAETVGVLDGGHIASRARVPVPVPRATDIVGRFQNADRMSRPAKPVQRIHPRKPGPDDNHVKFLTGSHSPIIPCRKRRQIMPRICECCRQLSAGRPLSPWGCARTRVRALSTQIPDFVMSAVRHKFSRQMRPRVLFR